MALTAFLAVQSFTSELIVVDDSSDDDTPAVVEDVRADAENFRVLRNEQNRGKGFSVARGMLASRGLYRIFTDADLAYPPEEVDKIVADLDAGADVAIACRVLPESRYLMSPTFFSYLYTRHVMSRVFNAAVRWTLVPGVLDTQAGLKGFTAAAAETVFSRLTIARFGFDVEALYIARRHGLPDQADRRALPLRQRAHDGALRARCARHGGGPRAHPAQRPAWPLSLSRPRLIVNADDLGISRGGEPRDPRGARGRRGHVRVRHGQPARLRPRRAARARGARARARGSTSTSSPAARSRPATLTRRIRPDRSTSMPLAALVRRALAGRIRGERGLRRVRRAAAAPRGRGAARDARRQPPPRPPAPGRSGRRWCCARRRRRRSPYVRVPIGRSGGSAATARDRRPEAGAARARARRGGFAFGAGTPPGARPLRGDLAAGRRRTSRAGSSRCSTALPAGDHRADGAPGATTTANSRALDGYRRAREVELRGAPLPGRARRATRRVELTHFGRL